MTVETATRPAVAEPTTPIRPSEALRLGRLIRPDSRIGVLFDGDTGACSLGAMAVAVGLGPADEETLYYDITKVLAGIGRAADCPVPDCTERFVPCSVRTIVWHLNDQHGYTDGQIGAWLEGLGL